MITFFTEIITSFKKTLISIIANIKTTLASAKPDYILLILLSIIQFGSGTTSVLGAMEVLPISIAEPIGIIIQLLLFLLLSGFTAVHAPIRKWIAILVLTFFSIYSSFFVYYKTIAGEALKIQNYSEALQAHTTLVAEVYSPLQDEYRNLETDANTFKKKAEQEVESGLTTGKAGRGPKAKSFEEKAIEKQEEANKFKSILEYLDPLFNYETNGLKPEQIFQKDSYAWGRAPEKLRKNYPKPKLNQYIAKKTQVRLLTGYNKVMDGEQAAIASMLIAVAVDGISLMLGTAISKRKGSSIIKRFFLGISKIISDLRFAKNILRRSFRAPLDDNYQTITMMLKGNSSEFLQHFADSIESQPPHRIGYEDSLENHENETFRRGYRRLINKLQQLRWIQRKSDTWEVAQEHFNRLSKWLSDEIERNIQKEARSENDDWLPFINNDRSDRVQNNRVEIRIPLC